MEGMQRPRGECPIVKLTRESRGGWGGGIAALPPLAADAGGQAVAGLLDTNHADAVGGGGGGAGEEEEKRLRFGIILMSDEGMWPQE